MKKFIKYIGILLLPVLIIIPAVNYLVDPGHIFGDEYVNKIMTGIRQGKNVTNVTEFNHRKLREAYVKMHKGETFDYIILGSSRAMGVSQDAFPGKKILNLGMRICNLEDFAAVYQMCEDFNVGYKHVLFTADFTYFDANTNYELWKSLRPYYNEYMKGDECESEVIQCIKNLYSFQYLHDCMQAITNGKIKDCGTKNLVYTSETVNDGMTFTVDGSWAYGNDANQRPQSLVDFYAETSSGGPYVDYKVSKKRKKLFDRIVKSFSSRGKIIFFIPPVHPIFYDRWTRDLNGVVPAAKWVEEYAIANNIPVVGGFNPADFDLKNTDFYDGVHCKNEKLNALVYEGLKSLDIEQ
jgi:hypothetical protein